MKIKILQRVEMQHKFYDKDAHDMAYQKMEFAEGVEVDLTNKVPDWSLCAIKLIRLGYAEEVVG